MRERLYHVSIPPLAPTGAQDDEVDVVVAGDDFQHLGRVVVLAVGIVAPRGVVHVVGDGFQTLQRGRHVLGWGLGGVVSENLDSVVGHRSDNLKKATEM